MSLPALGIDISKLKFNACLIKSGRKFRHKVFSNTASGFEQLSAWLSQQGVERAHACLEATGTYGNELAAYLNGLGHVVSVVNPAAIKAFARSQLSRTKTDKADATVIASFCSERRPPAWRPPAPEMRELQALVRRLEALQEMRTAEVNRLSSGIAVEAVRESVEELIAHLSEQIERTEKLIRAHIDSHPGLKGQAELLDTIPGIGETTAAALLAEVPDILQYKSARQVAAFAGLVPRERQSGSSVRGRVRLSKIGSSRLRKALYFPAGVCAEVNSEPVTRPPATPSATPVLCRSGREIHPQDDPQHVQNQQRAIPREKFLKPLLARDNTRRPGIILLTARSNFAPCNLWPHG